MLYRMVITIVLLSSFTLWQGCGQSDFNDSEVNRSVTQADDDSSNNSNDDDSSDDDTNDDDSTDITAPTVASTSPDDEATSVSISSSISVTFSESMDATSVTTNTGNNSCSGTLQLSSNDFSTCVMMSEEPDASNSKQRYTLKPASDLSYSTTYKIRVTTGVKDSAGNALASAYTHSTGFTTSSTPDTTAPTVSSSSPADSVTSVAVNSTISVTFSEAMDTTTLTTNTSNTSCSGSLQVSSDNFGTCVQMSSSPSISNSNKTFTVTPSSDLSYSTTYKIRVTKLEVKG